jgi:hypothetical protein
LPRLPATSPKLHPRFPKAPWGSAGNQTLGNHSKPLFVPQQNSPDPRYHGNINRGGLGLGLLQSRFPICPAIHLSQAATPWNPTAARQPCRISINHFTPPFSTTKTNQTIHNGFPPPLGLSGRHPGKNVFRATEGGVDRRNCHGENCPPPACNTISTKSGREGKCNHRC